MSDPILPIMIDGKVGILSYLKAIIFGRNFEISELSYDQDGDEVIASGSFLLTLSSRSLTVTKDRKPFIVKSWRSVDTDLYFQDEKRSLPYVISGVKICDVFKDSSSGYWELVEDDESKYLILKQNQNSSITIAFQ